MIIDAKIADLATSPERAVDGIETMYRELRNRLVREFREEREKGKSPAEKAKAG